MIRNNMSSHLFSLSAFRKAKTSKNSDAIRKSVVILKNTPKGKEPCPKFAANSIAIPMQLRAWSMLINGCPNFFNNWTTSRMTRTNIPQINMSDQKSLNIEISFP